MGADVGQLLALEDINLEIIAAGVLAHDHAAIDLPARLDHHRAAILQIPECESDREAIVGRDQNTVAAALQVSLMGGIAVEYTVEHGGTAAVGEELALVADQPAGRRVEHKPNAAAAGWAHLDHLGLALRHLLHHHTRERLVDVDHDLLDRLAQIAGRRIPLEQHLGPGDRELIALPPHGLDQDAELQFAAAGHLNRVALG